MRDFKCEDIVSVNIGGKDTLARFFFRLKHKPGKAFIYVMERVKNGSEEILYLVAYDDLRIVERPSLYYWQEA